MLYTLNYKPKDRHLETIIEHHKTHYVDYCKVWFENGTKKIYYNTEPVCYWFSADEIMIDFVNPIIHRSSFKKMGIVRAKRVLLPIDRQGKVCYNKYRK